jgi:hypothetical protein
MRPLCLIALVFCACGGSTAVPAPADNGVASSLDFAALSDSASPPDLAPALDLAAPPDLLLPSGQCRSDSDCKQAQFCLAPGAFAGCGICRPVLNPCTGDAECKSASPSSICAPVVCACNGGSACTQGCLMNTDCGVAQYCDPTNHCVASVCLKNSDCPIDFSCGADNHCARTTCAADVDCSGYCVDRGCYSQPGSCIFPPA